MFIYTADNDDRFTDDMPIDADILIEGIRPEDRIVMGIQCPVSKCVNLLIQAFRHLTDLGSGDPFDSKLFCESLDLSG